MGKYVKYLSVFSILLFLSGCSLMPWYHSTTMKINLERVAKDKSHDPVTVIVMQPVEQKEFVTANYSTVAQSALNKGTQRYVLLGNQDSESISMTVEDAPLAIYFIMKNQPISNWKYLVESPQGASESFSISQYEVKKV